MIMKKRKKISTQDILSKRKENYRTYKLQEKKV